MKKTELTLIIFTATMLAASITATFLISNAQAAASPLTSATVKVTCQADGGIDVRVVPLNHQ